MSKKLSYFRLCSNNSESPPYQASRVWGRGKAILLAVSGIVLGGLFLRLAGVSYGFPHLYHSLEVTLVGSAVKMGEARRLLPIAMTYPSLFKYVLLACYSLWYGVGHLMGSFASVNDFKALYFTNPTGFYLIGRLLSVGFGSLTMWLVYRLGKEAESPTVGVIAALLLAVNFFHVRDSHFLMLQVPATFFVAGAMCVLLRLDATGRLREAVWFGLWTGLALSTNYSSGMLVAPGVAWVLMRDHPSRARAGVGHRLRLMTVAAGVGIAVYLAANPDALMYPKIFWKRIYEDFLVNSLMVQSKSHLPEMTAWRFYIQYTLGEGWGWPLALAAVISVPVALWRRRRADWLLLAFICPFYVFMGAGQLFYHRYFHLAIPLLAVLTAGLLVGAYGRMSALFGASDRARQIAGVAILGGFLLMPTARVLKFDALLHQQDTRTLAKRWIEETLPQNASIQVLGEPFRNVPLWHDRPSLERQRALTPNLSKLVWLADVGDGNYPTPRYDLVYYPLKDDHLLSKIRPVPQAYVVYPDWHPEEKRSKAIRDYLETAGTVVKHITPVVGNGHLPSTFWLSHVNRSLWKVDKLGPPITIYRINDLGKNKLVP